MSWLKDDKNGIHVHLFDEWHYCLGIITALFYYLPKVSGNGYLEIGKGYMLAILKSIFWFPILINNIISRI